MFYGFAKPYPSTLQFRETIKLLLKVKKDDRGQHKEMAAELHRMREPRRWSEATYNLNRCSKVTTV
jgi:hypothetical protein